MSGFFPSFFQTHTDELLFLENITSPLWVHAEYADLDAHWCESIANRPPRVLNPFWAGDFDVNTGCDTYSHDSVRYIDSRCKECEECLGDILQCQIRQELFRRQTHEMPTYCRLHADTAVFRPRLDSLKETILPLCDQTPTESSSCAREHGALFGYSGSTVASLYATGPDPEIYAGLWNKNSVLRKARNSPALDVLAALKILPHDIGGHNLEFVINQAAQLVIGHVHMSEDFSAEYVRRAEHWMPDVESVWNWQHTTHLLIDPAQNPFVTNIDWRCPLQWRTAYANASKSFAARTPNRLRNSVRFQHITGRMQTFAHPTVRSMNTLQGSFDTGRYVSDVHICVSPAPCTGGQTLQDALTFYRSLNEWHDVELLGTGTEILCNKTLDWPHGSYTLVDGAQHLESQSEETCHLGDRFPSFKIRQKLISASSAKQMVLGSGTDVHKVCVMQRLSKIPSMTHLKLHADDVLQHCSQINKNISCTWLHRDQNSAFSVYNTTVLVSLPHSPNRRLSPYKKTKCSACNNFEQSAKIVKQYGEAMESLPVSMLSVGRPVQLHISRQIAKTIRQTFCNFVSDTNCSSVNTLTKQFLPQTWESSENFLQAFLSMGKVQQRFFQEDFINSAFRHDLSNSLHSLNDDVLWNRPWVFCPEQETCQGQISKQDWLNPATRYTQCAAQISKHALTTARTVPFCQLDSNTQTLCQKTVEWNLAARKILCELAGMPECMKAGHFYLPSEYSMIQHQFVSDAVQDYYDNLSPGTCPLQQSVQDQREINAKRKQECPSEFMAAIISLLRQAQLLVGNLVQLLRYGFDVVWSLFKILIGSISGVDDLIHAGAQDFVKSLAKYYEALGEIIVIIVDALVKILLETGLGQIIWEGIVLPLCLTIRFVFDVIVGCGLHTSGDFMICDTERVGLCSIFHSISELFINTGHDLNAGPLFLLSQVHRPDPRT